MNRTGSVRTHYGPLRSGIVNFENVPLKALIASAYNVNRNLIYGPAWLNSDHFDVNAKTPPGVSDSDVRLMLQSLLKARFRLAFHGEQREMDAYDMVVAKGGLKLPRFDPQHEPPQTQPATRGSMLLFGAGTLKALASGLTTAAGKPVVDRTGVGGLYFWDLRYTALDSQVSDNPGAPPDIFTAIQAQLGLKLKSKEQPIEVLVVDSIDRIPSEN